MTGMGPEPPGELAARLQAYAASMTTSVGSGRTGLCGSLHGSMVGLDQSP